MIFKSSIIVLLFVLSTFQFTSQNVLKANPTLKDLPDDVTFILLRKLSWKDLPNISTASKKFYNLAHRPEFWQNNILELYPEDVRKIQPNNNFPVQHFKAIEKHIECHLNKTGFHTRSAYSTEWKSDDLQYIAYFPRLKTLHFSLECHIRPYALPYLRKLTELQELHINCFSLKNTNLEEIGNLTNLKILGLYRFHDMDEEGLSHIKRLTNLEELTGIELKQQT